MTTTMRSTYRNLHARKARVAMRQKPRLSMGLASVVLASLWRLWRQHRLVSLQSRKRHKIEISWLSEELQRTKQKLDEATAMHRSTALEMLDAAYKKQKLTSDQISKRLSKVEENLAYGSLQRHPLSTDESMGDPFVYEREPLLAGGPPSSTAPTNLGFSSHHSRHSYDALSSSQSLEQLQLSDAASWDLLDGMPAGKTSAPFKRQGEDQDTTGRASGHQQCQTDIMDLLSLPDVPPTPKDRLDGQDRHAPAQDMPTIVPDLCEDQAISELRDAKTYKGSSTFLHRRRNLLTKQAMHHAALCAQEESREVYNSSALEALSRAGEQLGRTERLMREAEQTDEVLERIRQEQPNEPGAGKSYDLKLAEHQAGRAKSSCDAAYSKLCSALETAARLAAMPLTESNSRHQLQPAQNGTSRSTPMSRAESSDQQIGRIPRSGFQKAVSQKGIGGSSNHPPIASRHHRSASSISPMTSALERRSMSTEGSMASSASKLLPSFNATAGLSRHHRSFSENFDGSSRAELPVADPLASKTSTPGSLKEVEEASDGHTALINELELRRLALHMN